MPVASLKTHDSTRSLLEVTSVASRPARMWGVAVFAESNVEAAASTTSDGSTPRKTMPMVSPVLAPVYRLVAVYVVVPPACSPEVTRW